MLIKIMGNQWYWSYDSHELLIDIINKNPSGDGLYN